MKQTAIFWPMLAHVLLVYVVYIVLRLRRGAAVRAGSVRVGTFKLRGTEPEISAAAHGNILNQFELPVLFHVCCLAFFVTAGANHLVLALAWVFVASRYVHALIHLTLNRVLYRSAVFILGAVVLAVMWMVFALHIAQA